ncbi:MAG: hypothetical protein ABIK65_09435 [Candidatus Eisenbacteria bacterium]
MSRSVTILLSSFLLVFLACSDGGDPVSPGDGNDGGDTTAVAFAGDVLPILTSSCAFVGCHASETHSGNLVLDGANAYANLVGVASFNYPPGVRVTAGDPDASVLYQKLLGNPSFDARMPLGGAPLAGADLAKIREWIEEGAKND